MDKIKEAGFKVSLSKETTLTKEMAEQLYADHKGKQFFDELTDTMSRFEATTAHVRLVLVRN